MKQKGRIALFSNDKDREKFYQILQQVKTKFGFKLYAYCFIKIDEYCLLIDANGADISQIMKSVNITYAMYKENKTGLFRDRYKSELIKDADMLNMLLTKIHQFGHDNKFNSGCFFNQTNNHSFLDPMPEEPFLQKEFEKRISSLEEGRGELERVAELKGLSVEELLKNRELRNNQIKDFRRNSTLSLKEIGTLFGGLSESMVSKILSEQS